MLIGAIDCGTRTAENIVISPVQWFSTGISLAGDVVTTHFNTKEQDITITWIGMQDSVKTSLETYLNDTIKAYGTVSVTPDANDDLGIGASGATNLTYIGNSFTATWIAYKLWNVTIQLRKYS